MVRSAPIKKAFSYQQVPCNGYVDETIRTQTDSVRYLTQQYRRRAKKAKYAQEQCESIQLEPGYVCDWGSPRLTHLKTSPS